MSAVVVYVMCIEVNMDICLVDHNAVPNIIDGSSLFCIPCMESYKISLISEFSFCDK